MATTANSTRCSWNDWVGPAAVGLLALGALLVVLLASYDAGRHHRAIESDAASIIGHGWGVDRISDDGRLKLTARAFDSNPTRGILHISLSGADVDLLSCRASGFFLSSTDCRWHGGVTGPAAEAALELLASTVALNGKAKAAERADLQRAEERRRAEEKTAIERAFPADR